MKRRKKMSDGEKCVICFALAVIMGLLLFYTYTDDSRNDYNGIIRLHVIANSDSAADQALKLKVRDAVIDYMSKQDDLETSDETEKYLEDNLDRLEAIAAGVIASEDSDYTARADIGIRYIPEKTYGDITFPAGNYKALNITIGSGQGENWWCVLFPPLCLLDEGTEQIDSDPAADAAADPAGTADPDDAALTETRQLQLKWKLQEILNKDQTS